MDSWGRTGEIPSQGDREAPSWVFCLYKRSGLFLCVKPEKEKGVTRTQVERWISV